MRGEQRSPGDRQGPGRVGEVERHDEPALEPRPVPDGALASIGTHDTPTFAGWWWGRDVEIRRELDQQSPEEAEAELEGRGVMRDKLARGLEAEAPSGRKGSGAGDIRDPASSGEKPSGEEPLPGEEGGVGRALAVQEALLRRLGRSSAGLVLATMEDFWLEPEPQNVPGTTGRTNWRRRSARPLEALGRDPAQRLMHALNHAREGIE